jgi:LmbE family N-acetylglucosaminyl deacetylase
LDRRIDLSEAMRGIIAQKRPAVIFTPFVNDPHPDHVATNRILAMAFEGLAMDLPLKILAYEVWSLVPPTIVSNVDAQIDAKEKLLLRYRTGMRTTDYVHNCMELHAWNANRLMGRKGFDECFHSMTLHELNRYLGGLRK